MENPCTYLEAYCGSRKVRSGSQFWIYGNMGMWLTNFTGVWLFRRKLMRCIELEGMCHLIPTVRFARKHALFSQHRRKNDDGGTVIQLSYDFFLFWRDTRVEDVKTKLSCETSFKFWKVQVLEMKFELAVPRRGRSENDLGSNERVLQVGGSHLHANDLGKKIACTRGQIATTRK